MAERLIRLENISKSYGEKQILKGLNLYVRDKEFVTLLGPSGCGKTTTLRLIGGFETPDEGTIYFSGKPVNNIPPNKRPVNTVFQRYALFTHLNVYDNIAFGLRIAKVSEGVIRGKVQEMLRLVGLSGYEKRQVSSLSGGEQQRIAIARALVNHPKVLLLDEPLGALDLKLRKEMQHELKAIQQQVGITFVYVTHDQEEALTMSDTIVVMKKGFIQQIGTPVDIYNEPKNAFVADFIGESNIIDGVMKEDYLVNFCGTDFPCSDAGFGANEPVDVVVRPEDITLTPYDKGQIRGKVTSVTFMGVHYEIEVESEHFTWTIHSIRNSEVGENVGIYLHPDDIHIMHKTPKEEQDA